ncbi:transient receptor potential cation channel subfamily A member 1 [Vigna unguiculata]|uniref:Transient receptor potential cation channel subfamily A member 1 n=1 Tax=Vigna unguiculata TaxID=3917 RepID=A0A4D6LHZ7_VIGUN|nr:transient receptor potential cation channel subfamily A member 1 [Vigna unguiculata]
MAVDKGRERIVELICCHFPELLIKRNVRGDTALHVAVRSKNSTIMRFNLSYYAIEKVKHDEMKDNKEIPREKNKYENTPLHEVVYNGDVGTVKEILIADKDVVHCLNKSRRSPLYLAVLNANLEILHLLLEVPFPTRGLARATKSLLGEIEYFMLKKGSCLGNHILAWVRIAKIHGLLHKLSLRRKQAHLSENGDNCLA